MGPSCVASGVPFLLQVRPPVDFRHSVEAFLVDRRKPGRTHKSHHARGSRELPIHRTEKSRAESNHPSIAVADQRVGSLYASHGRTEIVRRRQGRTSEDQGFDRHATPQLFEGKGGDSRPPAKGNQVKSCVNVTSVKLKHLAGEFRGHKPIPPMQHEIEQDHPRYRHLPAKPGRPDRQPLLSNDLPRQQGNELKPADSIQQDHDLTIKVAFEFGEPPDRQFNDARRNHRNAVHQEAHETSILILRFSESGSVG